MARKRSSSKKGSDVYKRLLDKIGSIDMGSNLFWAPPQGRSVIRILPPVGNMEFFFAVVGQHYIDGKNNLCPAMCTDGKEKCPACEVNEMLYSGGEVDAAKKFRAGRRFYMNVIVRGEEGAGPRIFTPGVQVFSTLATFIGDPDYGEIYDVDDGTDITIDRTGTGIDTEYQVFPKREYSLLSDNDVEIEEWLDAAVDLSDHVAKRLLSYDELAEATGADVYLDANGWEEEEDDDYEYPDEEDEDHEQTASAKIAERLARRKGAVAKRKQPRRRR